MLLTHLPLIVEWLFQRCHLSRIDEVLKCNDSMTEPQMLSQIPSSCQYFQLSVLETATSFFPSHVKILFYMGVKGVRGIESLSGKILLYLDSVPVIVSRFTSLIETL